MAQPPRPRPQLQTRLQPSLTYLGPEPEAVPSPQDAAAAQRLAHEHAYLVQRLVDRLSARLPEDLDGPQLMRRGDAALYEAATTTEATEDFPAQAVEGVQSALRHWLGASEWYRQAVVWRAEPLLRSWRALLLAGREATDHALCRRLRVSPDQLSARFIEFAMVFALEPEAFLPLGADVKYSMAATIGGLHNQQQLALALYFHQELTFPEIAKVMDLEPERAQEVFGRAAAAVCVEAALASWPGRRLRA